MDVLSARVRQTCAKTRVAIVGPPALSRLIQHVFRGENDFEITGCVTGPRGLTVQPESPLADLILVHIQPTRVGIGTTLHQVRRANLRAKVILICPVSELARHGRECGADSCVMQESLVTQLLPAARALSRSRAVPRSSGRRWPGEVFVPKKTSRRSS